MSTYLQFIVLGLGLGAVYIGLTTGLVLVYRATGIINFAQGAMAMWGVYVYAQLRIDGTLVLPIGRITLGAKPLLLVAALIGIAMSVLLGILAHYLVFRPVRHAPVLAQVVVSVALMLTLQALVIIRFGPNNIVVESIVPQGSVSLFGVEVSSRELVMTAVMVVLAALVWAYLRFTRAGVATRAASENERGAILMGFAPDRLAGVAMVLASVVATVGVLLGASLTGLNPANYTLLVVPALAVLLIAKMESIGVVVAASLVLGAFQSVVNLLVSKPWWPAWAQSGVDQVIPFVLVMVILFLFGRRLPSRGTLQTIRLPDVHMPRIRPVPAVVLVGVAVAVLALTQDSYRFGVTYSIVLMLVALSYVVVTGYLGQISLAQTSFAGAAGFTLSKVTMGWDMPFPLAVLFCSLVAALLGMVVALPAFRIRGAQLAIVTIAAALAIERFVFNNYALTPPEGNPIADPTLFGLNVAVRQGSEIRVVDDNDDDVPPGVVGEVISRSDAVMAGYLEMPEETERALRGGWFRGGDLAYRDDEGYMYIAGRVKDMIIRGGENIYPVEIETVLSRLPGVTQAAVVGRPDERWGEIVVAVLTLADGASVTREEVRTHCRAHLAAYKVPDEVHVLGEMPVNASGKILKRELRRVL